MTIIFNNCEQNSNQNIDTESNTQFDMNSNNESKIKIDSERTYKISLYKLKTEIKNVRFERDKRLLEWRNYLKPFEDQLAELYLSKRKDIGQFEEKLKNLREECITQSYKNLK